MTRRTAALVVFTTLAALLATLASAQQPTPRPPLDSAKPPALTEVETLKLQLNMTQVQSVQQQFQILQMQAQQLTSDREALLRSIEAQHPGWIIDRASLEFKKAPIQAATPKK